MTSWRPMAPLLFMAPHLTPLLLVALRGPLGHFEILKKVRYLNYILVTAFEKLIFNNYLKFVPIFFGMVKYYFINSNDKSLL